MRTTNQRAGSKNVFLMIAFMMVSLLTSLGEADSQVVVTNTVLPRANIIKIDPPPGQEAKLGMNILDISVGFPIYGKENAKTGAFTEITNSIGFRSHTFSIRLPDGETEFFPDDLYAINYSLELAKSLSKKWYLVTFGSAGVYTDFEKVDVDHFLFEGGTFFVRRVHKNFDFGLGPVFTYAFGEPVVIPAPFLRFRGPERRVKFEMKIPRYVTVGYAISQGFELGVAWRSLYNNYSLGDARAVDQNGKSTTIVFSDITLGIESSIRLFNPLFLNLGLGTTVNREFVVDDNDGDELFDRGMEDTIFFTAGLNTRL